MCIDAYFNQKKRLAATIPNMWFSSMLYNSDAPEKVTHLITMTKQKFIETTINAVNNLSEGKANEMADFAEFLLKK